MAKARLRRGIELVKLTNRIEALKMQEDETEDVPGAGDVPANAKQAAGEALAAGNVGKGLEPGEQPRKKTLSNLAKGAIFREVVLAKVREMKAQEERERIERQASR